MEHHHGLIALGALASLAVGARASAQTTDAWRQMWGIGDDPTATKYEELFDQPYQARPFDPLMREHPFYEVEQFERAEDQRVAGVSWRSEETPDAVTLSIRYPGSADKPLDVTVEHGLVHVKPSPQPEASSPYHFYAAGSRLITIDVPEHAKADTARVKRQGDTIVVAFDRG